MMDGQKANAGPVPRWLVILAGGYLIYLFILLGISAAFLIPLVKTSARTPPTPSVTVSSTPQILVHAPLDKSSIRYEDFSSDVRDWNLAYLRGKIETINNRLILQSYAHGGPAVGQNQLFIPAGSLYYVQADFMTDVDADQPYGLVFGRDNELDTFYLFEILPRLQQFAFYKYTPGTWETLVPFSGAEMKPYPQANTLSAYFDKGQIELYINGNRATSYTDQRPYLSVGVGAFAADPSYRLIVSDFFAYSEK
ncbi:MAG TPA: hypothetical protein VLZ89_10305 [Anaerolineales bacterium]|nr:hypothetical protein [Anaerolineales bacterium]